MEEFDKKLIFRSKLPSFFFEIILELREKFASEATANLLLNEEDLLYFDQFVLPGDINLIKNPDNKRLYVLKAFACYLHYGKKMSRCSILPVLPLIFNQIKKSFQDHIK